MENTDILNVQLLQQKRPGHYVLNNKNYTIENMEGKIFAARFDEIENPTLPSFLSLNGMVEYPLYNSDGVNFLSIADLYNSVVLLTLNNKKWQLVKTAFRTMENIGHILMDEQGSILPNRQTIKIINFHIQDNSKDSVIELYNPVWTQPFIQGLDGVINSSEWVPLYRDIFEAPTKGIYRITINLWLNNVDEPMREVGIRVGDKEDWLPQYKRLRHAFVITGVFNRGDSLVPEVYVDKMSTSNTINIEASNFCIECLNTLEL